jgi:hypothetical protein
VVPGQGQTALSQLARQLYGPGVLYGFTQASTAGILLLAANTAFNDFPRVLFYLARDRQAPQMFLRMGDRLAFSNGILVLSVAAALLYAAFGGKTDPLIPLFAVGVFLAFTLSQTGMVALWWRERGEHWRRSLAFNAVGATMSGAVFITAGVTKFVEGAWVAVIAVLLFVGLALGIRRHYDRASAAVELHHDTIEVPGNVEHLSVVPLEVLDRPAMRALAYAASLGQPVLALHVSPTKDEAERFRGYWKTWGEHLPLEVVVSPYRTVVTPLVDAVEALAGRHKNLVITVVIPEVVVEHWWQALLHDRIAPRLRRMLRHLPSVVITSVPFHL